MIRREVLRLVSGRTRNAARVGAVGQSGLPGGLPSEKMGRRLLRAPAREKIQR